ncbi:CP17A-like protein [Mya arenaria]|uniref:CP17A-like protein n=1 Tax=Mya arenaria TaxID=6604 RepID=A0ABY7EM19_MYAAR|nr:CP17A-like protein [Mya arenaria]
MHLYKIVDCTVLGKCKHTYKIEDCTVLGKYMHLYKIENCTVLGKCKHPYKIEDCTVLGKCKHPYKIVDCTVLRKCMHVYKIENCTIQGKCKHLYNREDCSTLGKVSESEIRVNKCTIQGNCTHLYKMVVGTIQLLVQLNHKAFEEGRKLSLHLSKYFYPKVMAIFQQLTNTFTGNSQLFLCTFIGRFNASWMSRRFLVMVASNFLSNAILPGNKTHGIVLIHDSSAWRQNTQKCSNPCQFCLATKQMAGDNLFVVAVVTLTLYYLVQDVYLFYIKGTPKGPFSLPIIGNMHLVDMKHPHLSMAKIAKKYGKMFTIRMGPMGRFLIVQDIEIINQIAECPFANDRPDVPIFEKINQGMDGIGSCKYGGRWKTMTHTLHKGISHISNKSMQDTAVHANKQLIDRFAAKSGVAYNPRGDIVLLCSAMLSSIVYGIELESLDSPELCTRIHYHSMIMSLLSPSHPFNIFPWLWDLPLPIPARARLQKCLLERNNLMESMFDSHAENFTGSVHDIMDVIVQFENMKKDANVTKHDLFISAWAIYLAGAAIFECLRYASPIAIGIPHLTSKDIYINGYCIPKDTTIMMNQHHVHHNPEYWPDPDQFKPERFLDAQGNLYPTHHIFNNMPFIPFGRGKRPCIGRLLALDMLLIELSMILQRFTLRLPPGFKPDLDGSVVLNLRPSPFPVQFIER